MVVCWKRGGGGDEELEFISMGVGRGGGRKAQMGKEAKGFSTIYKAGPRAVLATMSPTRPSQAILSGHGFFVAGSCARVGTPSIWTKAVSRRSAGAVGWSMSFMKGH